MRPVRLTFGDVGDAEKLEKDRTLMLRPIVTDRTRPVAKQRLGELSGNDQTLASRRPVVQQRSVRSQLDR